MKHNIIKTENYLLVVDDSEIKVGDWFYLNDANIIAEYISVKPVNEAKKITAHLPLNNSPVLEGVPLLPMMKTIAEQLNVKEFPFRIKDSKGRIIYFEESDKRWAKYEHDSEGNVIYLETSSGYWSKREYDVSNKEIYYKNSEGLIVDKRPKPCEDKVVDIDGVKYKLVKL